MLPDFIAETLRSDKVYLIINSPDYHRHAGRLRPDKQVFCPFSYNSNKCSIEGRVTVKDREVPSKELNK